MWKAKNIVLWWAIAALTLMPGEADAWAATRRRHHHNEEMRAKRIATENAIAESLKKDTISFEKEYLKQQLDNQLESYFNNSGKKNLIAFYGEEWFHNKLQYMISKISANPKQFCEFSKDVKLHSIGLRKYEGEVVNDSIRLQIKNRELQSLSRHIFSEYFSEVDTKLENQVKELTKNSDMDLLNGHYWKERVDIKIKAIIEEMINNPQKYWRLEQWVYYLQNPDWSLIKEKEIKELWWEYFDEDSAAFRELISKISLIVIGAIWVFVVIKWIYES